MEYLGSIVVDATANLDEEPSFHRRRRPGRRRCIAAVMSYPSADEDQSVHWYCSVRDDNALIRGCQNNRLGRVS